VSESSRLFYSLGTKSRREEGDMSVSDNSITERVRALVQPIVDDLGLELYDLEYAGGMVKVTIDTPPGSPGGVDVDQLSRATRLISRDLDHADPIPGQYTLEVSSPGISSVRWASRWPFGCATPSTVSGA
jgi:ribosome maturation factor RimP